MKKNVIIILFVLGIALAMYYSQHPLSATVTVKGKMYLVDTAITAADKEKGLGYRDSMPHNYGMLFIYDHKSKYSFTMQGMAFPLDFLWINGNQIVDITKNVPITQDGVTPVVVPNVEADKVVELGAGEVDKQGIVVGDTVLFNK